MARKGAMDNAVGRGLLNGWQVSGISSLASGIPIRLSFAGDAGSGASRPRYFGTADVVGPGLGAGGNGLAPVYSCDPRLGGTEVGEKILDINCIGVPAFGENGDLVPPYNIRHADTDEPRPDAVQELRDPGDQKLQFRVGFFNLFNQAFANTNIGERHQPDARHDLQGRGRTACRTATAASSTTSATRPRASTSRRRRRTTSARST